MENRSHALIAGAFIILLLAGLVVASLWLSGRGRPHLVYDLVTGLPLNKLDARSPVKFQGVNVGSVTAIRFDRAHPGTTIVRVAIDADTPVTRGTYAELLYQGASAVPYVQLIDPDPTAAPLLTDARHPTRIPIVPTGLDETGEVAKIAMAQMAEMAKRLHRLLAPGNRASLQDTLTNLQAAAEAVRVLHARLEPAMQGLSGASGQAKAITQQARILEQDVAQLSTSLQQQAAALHSLAASAGEFKRLGAQAKQEIAQQTLPQIQTLRRHLSGLRGDAQRAGGRMGGADPGEPGFHPGR